MNTHTTPAPLNRLARGLAQLAQMLSMRRLARRDGRARAPGGAREPGFVDTESTWKSR